MNFDKIIVVTKKTPLEELIERFNTRAQAKFYIEHMGLSFDWYEKFHEDYIKSLAILKKSLPSGIRHQLIERDLLSTFTFSDKDLIVTLGQDGLVVNTAKYLSGQPLLAFNPAPDSIDGILLPFKVKDASLLFKSLIKRNINMSHISMAKAELNDGQSLYGVNDIFIGPQTHISARYSLSFNGRSEKQSSSGIIVSTGAGSTGWFRSIITGAAEIVKTFGGIKNTDKIKESYRFDWESDYLCFSVREPFISKTSSANIVFGKIYSGAALEITSHMPVNGVIFSDGIEKDFIHFNSGTVAKIGMAEKKLNLII